MTNQECFESTPENFMSVQDQMWQNELSQLLPEVEKLRAICGKDPNWFEEQLGTFYGGSEVAHMAMALSNELHGSHNHYNGLREEVRRHIETLFSQGSLEDKEKQLQQIHQLFTDILPDGAIDVFLSALNGDQEQALLLALIAPNPYRGILARYFYEVQAPIPAYQELLSNAWDHDHRYLDAAAGSRKALEEMFKYAAYETQNNLPPLVTVWRGTGGGSLDRAARGISWTIDRDVACWFAIRHCGDGDEPLVLKANVSRESIYFYTNERGEEEVVCFEVPNPMVDGTPTNWRKRFRAHEKKIRQQQIERLDLGEVEAA